MNLLPFLRIISIYFVTGKVTVVGITCQVDGCVCRVIECDGDSVACSEFDIDRISENRI